MRVRATHLPGKAARFDQDAQESEVQPREWKAGVEAEEEGTRERSAMSRHGPNDIERIKRVAAKMVVEPAGAKAHSLHRLVSPFEQWGDRYFGLAVQDGKATTEPSEDKGWTEYHLEYRGGDIWEIEVCPTENTGWTVWRGKIPTREIFVTIMQNIEEAPLIDWANAEVSEAADKKH